MEIKINKMKKLIFILIFIPVILSAQNWQKSAWHRYEALTYWNAKTPLEQQQQIMPYKELTYKHLNNLKDDISKALSWLSYSANKLTFTLTTGDRVANIVIQKGVEQ